MMFNFFKNTYPIISVSSSWLVQNIGFSYWIQKTDFGDLLKNENFYDTFYIKQYLNGVNPDKSSLLNDEHSIACFEGNASGFYKSLQFIKNEHNSIGIESNNIQDEIDLLENSNLKFDFSLSFLNKTRISNSLNMENKVRETEEAIKDSFYFDSSMIIEIPLEESYSIIKPFDKSFYFFVNADNVICKGYLTLFSVISTTESQGYDYGLVYKIKLDSGNEIFGELGGYNSKEDNVFILPKGYLMFDSNKKALDFLANHS